MEDRESMEWRPSMRAIGRLGCLGVLLLIEGIVPASPLQSATRADGTPPATVDESGVRAMIDSIVGTLLERHHPSRHWEPVRPPSDQSAQPTGRTALVVLALLDTGLPAQTPRIAEAIDWMADTPADGTYAIAARLMVWCRLPGRARERQLECDRLLERFSLDGGGWDYGPSPRLGFIDQSLTQFGLQAITEAARRGCSIPTSLFERVRARFLATQNPDGGWGYRRLGDPSRGSMTAAGVASLALIGDHLRPNRHQRARILEAMGIAFDWLENHFDAEANPGCRRWHLYWIHALERAARATGLRRLGSHDWFEESAAMIRRRLFLVEPRTPPRIRGSPRIDRLAFALLVLRRGLEPVAFACLDLDEAPPINDLLGGACRLVSKEIERDAGWLRVEPDDPPDAWRRFPVLVVRSPPDAAWLDAPDSALARRLSNFAEAGGLVIALPDSASSGVRLFARRALQAVVPSADQTMFGSIARADPVRRRAGRWRFDASQIGSSVRRWCVAVRVPFRPEGFSARTEHELAAMLASICLDRTGGRLPCRVPPLAKEAHEATPPRSPMQASIRRIEWEGDGLVEPASVRAWREFGHRTSPGPDHTTTPTLPSEGRRLAWLGGVGDADPAMLGDPLDVFDPTMEFLVVEAMSAEFRRAFLTWIETRGWRGGLPPAGAPANCLGIHDAQRCIGVIIDDRATRRLLGLRTPTDFTDADLRALHESIEMARRIDHPKPRE